MGSWARTGLPGVKAGFLTPSSLPSTGSDQTWEEERREEKGRIQTQECPRQPSGEHRGDARRRLWAGQEEGMGLERLEGEEL